MAVDPPSIPVAEDQALNDSSSNAAAEHPLEDNQSTSERTKTKVSNPEEESVEDDRGKQPVAPKGTPSTVEMGTRSKAKAGRKYFKDALISPPK